MFRDGEKVKKTVNYEVSVFSVLMIYERASTYTVTINHFI
jgi:hypothetical protein